MFEKGAMIVALTERGLATSVRIGLALEKVQIRYKLYAPEVFCSHNVTPFNGDLGGLFAKLFNSSDAIIPVMAVGIVVRSIAPYVSDKKTDPAVVVVDDLGKYAVSLLSGHLRGANRLTRIVAEAIGAIAVVTTATDLLGRKSVEEIAEERNLRIVNSESLTPVNSAIVNDRNVLFAAIGLAASPEIDAEPPKSVASVEQLKQMMEGYDAGVVIAQTVVPLESVTKPVALLVPKLNHPAQNDSELFG